MKRRGVFVILADILALAVILLVFAWLHHGMPRAYEPIQTIVSATPSPTAEQRRTTPAPTPEPTVQVEETPEPTPTVYPVGDFTATFPTQDTGEGAYLSWQTDDVRIAVDMVQENDITYFVADVWIRNIELFRTAFAKDQFGTGISESVKGMAVNNNAILAVSGDFCGAHNYGVVIRNGVLYRDKNGAKEVCVLYYDGVMETYIAKNFSLDEAIERGAWQAWTFGPRLLEDGKAREVIESKIARSNPRCALGYFEPGHYCLVIVDGRQRGYSEGMTLLELSALMESLGCVTAYNLDGGATAMMIYDGELASSPSEGGRYSSDIIFFEKEDE